MRNIEVKLVTIPEWSGGFIPFARVIHAKYLVVDAEHSWLGTSNWSKDYFFKSRNVGIVVNGLALRHVFVEGDGFWLSVMTTLVGLVLCCWSVVGRST